MELDSKSYRPRGLFIVGVALAVAMFVAVLSFYGGLSSEGKDRDFSEHEDGQTRPHIDLISLPVPDVSSVKQTFISQVDFANWPTASADFRSPPAFDWTQYPELSVYQLIEDHAEVSAQGGHATGAYRELFFQSADESRLEITLRVSESQAFARAYLLKDAFLGFANCGMLSVQNAIGASFQRDRYSLGDVSIATEDFPSSSLGYGTSWIGFARDNVAVSVYARGAPHSEILSLLAAIDIDWSSNPPLTRAAYEATAPQLSVAISVPQPIDQSTPFDVSWSSNLASPVLYEGLRQRRLNGSYPVPYDEFDLSVQGLVAFSSGLQGIVSDVQGICASGTIAFQITVIHATLRFVVHEESLATHLAPVARSIGFSRDHFAGYSLVKCYSSWHSTVEVVDSNNTVLGSGSTTYTEVREDGEQPYDIPLNRSLVAGEVIAIRDLHSLLSVSQVVGGSVIDTLIIGVPTGGDTTITLQGPEGAEVVLLLSGTIPDVMPRETPGNIPLGGTLVYTLSRPLITGEIITYSDYITGRTVDVVVQ